MGNGKNVGASASNDGGNVGQGGSVTIDVLSNDVLSPGATTWLTHQIVRYPQNGTALIGSIIYTPNPGFSGADNISYRACDNLGYCVVGEVDIYVGAANGGAERDDEEMPGTGFAPGRLTILPGQPVENRYADMGAMSLDIPTLGVQAPIVGVPSASAGWDVTWLGKDVGWLEGSAYPTWIGNSVLTGHVYNADGKPGIFINLGKLRWGDQIVIHFSGKRYIYEVREIKQYVNPSATDEMMAHKENPWLTLVTCQSYDEESNSYNWRLLVGAVLVKEDQ
jgi:LPXTG-site transpeptidase (sortase) family protein